MPSSAPNREVHLDARYEGVCASCRERISIGAEIFWDVQTRAVRHAGCAPTAGSETLSSPGATTAPRRSSSSSAPSRPAPSPDLSGTLRGASWDDAPMEGDTVTVTIEGAARAIRVTRVEGRNLLPDEPAHVEIPDHWEFTVYGRPA
jgi:hypothetical protein